MTSYGDAVIVQHGIVQPLAVRLTVLN